MKNIVVYHKNCLDGLAAAWVISQTLHEERTEFKALAYSDRADFLNELYTGANTKSLAEITLYIVDFSFLPEDFLTLTERVKHVVWLDHHKSAIEDWNAIVQDKGLIIFNEIATIILDTEKSGCGIAIDFVSASGTNFKTEIVDIIKCIEDRDLWKFKWAGSEEICLGINYRCPNLALQEFGEMIQNESCVTLNRIGLPLMTQRNQLIDRIIQNVFTITLVGYSFSMIWSPVYQSEIGAILIREKGLPVVIAYVNNNQDIVCSLRSKDELCIDVSDIAKLFGGGGHKNAAGFVLEASLKGSFIEKAIAKQEQVKLTELSKTGWEYNIPEKGVICICKDDMDDTGTLCIITEYIEDFLYSYIDTSGIGWKQAKPLSPEDVTIVEGVVTVNPVL